MATLCSPLFPLAPIAISRTPPAAEWRSSHAWDNHFAALCGQRCEAPWRRGLELTVDELRAIGPALSMLEAVESNPRGRLYDAARNYVAATGDVYYLPALQQQLTSRQRRAGLLRRYLRLTGAGRKPAARPEKRETLPPRFERALASELISLAVLSECYRAVGRASGSTVLRALCGEFVREDRSHLDFYRERLAARLSAWWPAAAWGFRLGQRTRLAAACWNAWRIHRRLFRASGTSPGALFRQCRARMEHPQLSEADSTDWYAVEDFEACPAGVAA